MGTHVTLQRLLQGTLDPLILKTLTWGPAHGYAIARWIEQLTGEVLKVGEGSLYPALHRLEERGWVESTWELSDTRRRAKVYRLTAAGRAQVRVEAGSWKQFVQAVSRPPRRSDPGSASEQSRSDHRDVTNASRGFGASQTLPLMPHGNLRHSLIRHLRMSSCSSLALSASSA